MSIYILGITAVVILSLCLEAYTQRRNRRRIMAKAREYYQQLPETVVVGVPCFRVWLRSNLM